MCWILGGYGEIERKASKSQSRIYVYKNNLNAALPHSIAKGDKRSVLVWLQDQSLSADSDEISE